MQQTPFIYLSFPNSSQIHIKSQKEKQFQVQLNQSLSNCPFSNLIKLQTYTINQLPIFPFINPILMFRQKHESHQQKPHFQPLACDSPQIKPSNQHNQVEEITLDDERDIQQIAQRKNRRKNLKSKKTNLIKIKPVQDDLQQKNQEIQYLPEALLQNQPQTIQNLQQTIQLSHQDFAKRPKQQQSTQTISSPVLYNISDESDPQHGEQTIPQSSRRPLKESPTHSQKRSDSDELDSPTKLIKSPRKNRSKELVRQKGHNARRFIKMKRQVEVEQQREVEMKEKRQPTQVFEYDDGKSSDEEEQYMDDQSEQESQNEQNTQNESQIKPQSQNQQNKPSITVFKSNSFYTLINAQIPKGNFVNCIIRRKRTDQYFQKIVTYELFLLQDKKYLMTCVKDRLFKTTSHFQFYRQKTNALKYHEDNLYAFMDSNFTGTEFVLKTIQKNDTNSQRSTAIDKSELIKMEQSTSAISDQVHKNSGMFQDGRQNGKNQDIAKSLDQKEVLFMSFKANFFGFGGQREVKILKKKNKKLKNTGNFSNLKSAQENGEIDKYTEINSKKAIQGKNGLELDFKGIAKMQSTKNIILEADNGKQVLVFGKVKEDIYAVAIGNPFSIIEGLSFGIANLDRKFFVN